MAQKISIAGFLSAAAMLCVSISACKRDEPKSAQPAAKVNTPPPQSSADDLRAMSEYVKNDKAVSQSSQALTSAKAPNSALTAADEPRPMNKESVLKAPEKSIGTDAITYTAPADWMQEQAGGPMRRAQFQLPRVAADTEDGQMIVFYFGHGQGGAVEANIARWKGMFTTADGHPIPESAVKRESREINGLKVTTLDITGRYVDPMSGKDTASTKQDWRMLSAIVESPQGPWFFKGVGPVATMGAQQKNFEEFVGSIRKNP